MFHCSLFSTLSFTGLLLLLTSWWMQADTIQGFAVRLFTISCYYMIHTLISSRSIWSPCMVVHRSTQEGWTHKQFDSDESKWAPPHALCAPSKINYTLKCGDCETPVWTGWRWFKSARRLFVKKMAFFAPLCICWSKTGKCAILWGSP